MSTEDILAERQKTHGPFSSHALISQQLKSTVRANIGDYGAALSFAQKEALEMIMHKVARILNGNANHKDHWDDIAGYATLVSRELADNTPVSFT